MTVYTKLINIQAELKAPKNQYNAFGKYNYRNAEDILEAVKPLLHKHKATLFINDDIVFVDGRHYVKATATFVDIETGESIQTSALAREEQEKKGMDGSQVTGASSSYARKYCLNGLFLIDDTKDSDFTNTHGKDKPANNNSNNNTYANNSNNTYSNNNNDLSYGDKSAKITLTQKQINWISDLCAKRNMNKEQAIAGYNKKFNKNISLDDITREDFDKLIEILKK